MAGKNNFAALKQHATKEYKFQQGKSIAPLNPHQAAHGGSINAVQLSTDEFAGIQGGVCAALAAHWLSEKLSSARHPAFAGDSAGAGVHTGRNLDTVVHNVPKFLAYKQDPSATEILAQHGLKPSDKAASFNPVVNQQVQVEYKSHSRDGSVYTQRTTRSVPVMADSLANACDERYLKQGRGVYIAFSVEAKSPGQRGGGHAVAAYRSRGGSLYFFDPNCGVYKISAVAAFFTAYVGCYDGIGYTLAINASRFDGFTYVDR